MSQQRYVWCRGARARAIRRRCVCGCARCASRAIGDCVSWRNVCNSCEERLLDLSNSTNQLLCVGSIVLCIAQVEHARDKTGKVCVYRTRGGAETSEFAESEVRRLIIVLPLELERARVPRCVWRVRARVHAQTNSLMTDVLYARLIS